VEEASEVSGERGRLRSWIGGKTTELDLSLMGLLLGEGKTAESADEACVSALMRRKAE
jgi:hypothetical protein